MKKEQLNELLYQALETEQGGIQVYSTALKCAVNADLKEEWQKYLDQTTNHETIVRGVFDQLDLDPSVDTPGRLVVRHIGESGRAMEMALGSGSPTRPSWLPVNAWSSPRPRITSTGNCWCSSREGNRQRRPP